MLAAMMLSVASRATAAAAPGIVEEFAATETIGYPQVSPDGKTIAYLNSSGTDMALAAYHLDTGKGEILCKVDDRITGFAWKGSDKILFYEQLPGYGYLRSVSPGKAKLNTFGGFGDRRTMAPIVDWLFEDDRHIQVRNGRLGLMDVETGEIVENGPSEPLMFAGPYIHDSKGMLRLRCLQWRDGIELQHRRTDSDDFKTIHRWSWEDPVVRFMGFAGDPEISYLLTQTEGEWGEIRPLNTTTSEIGAPIAKGDGAEIYDVLYSRDHSRLEGVEVSEPNGPSQRWLDPVMRRRQASIDAALPGRRNWIVSKSLDESTLLIDSSKDGVPGIYFALDTKKGALKQLGARLPLIELSKLAQPRVLEIPARDGVTLHAVLSEPPGLKGAAPLVLIPRSDIFGFRASTGFEPVHQFLVRLGYSVLVVDFRGCRGYGKTYAEAGRHQIARKIPDDIEDAARWAVANGHALDSRICLFGSDVGGTVALIAATRTPELYSCVINQNGAPDLRDIEDTDNDNWITRKLTEKYFSDDPKVMASASALSAIGKLHGPILNIYENSMRSIEWNHLESALKSAKKPYVLFKDLDYTARPLLLDYRLNYYRQLADFLAADFPAAAGH